MLENLSESKKHKDNILMQTEQHKKYLVEEQDNAIEAVECRVNSLIRILFDLEKMKKETDIEKKEVIIRKILGEEAESNGWMEYFHIENIRYNTFSILINEKKGSFAKEEEPHYEY